MRFLLDTHTFLWWLIDDARLSDFARKSISNPDNTIYISSASAWEIATKYRLGKLPGVHEIVNEISSCIVSQGFKELVITVDDGQRAGLLKARLRDPFDRMLIAQTQIRDLLLISKDLQIHEHEVDVVW